MIRATIRGRDAALVVTLPNLAVLERAGDPAALEMLEMRVRDVFAPGHPWFNPRCGGPYDGFDPANEDQCGDALRYLERVASLEVQVTDRDAETRPPVPYFHDDRDESVRFEDAYRRAKANPFALDDLEGVPMPERAYAGSKQPRKRSPP
jgi:hypothetical protein